MQVKQTLLMSCVLIAMFLAGVKVRADQVVSQIAITQTGADISTCTGNVEPKAAITTYRNHNVSCTWKCPSEQVWHDCTPNASQTHNKSVTGECGQIGCEGVVSAAEELTIDNNHVSRIAYANKQIQLDQQGNQVCNVVSSGNDERYFPRHMQDSACGVGACPGMEYEVETCEAGESTWWNSETCTCVTSPIVLDVDGDGLDLTSVREGVRFDLDLQPGRELLSWPKRLSRDGLLVLDRNRNGRIDDGAELFGSTTAQPKVRKSNGFLALAVFDQVSEGGNGDGGISAADAVFPRLRVWFDSNHDGASQAVELVDLGRLGIERLGLTYKVSNEQDAFGNAFRFIGEMAVRAGAGGRLRSRPMVDVFLQNGGRDGGGRQ